MPLSHVLGLDHVMITVRDLDQAQSRWAALGFTLSPRGFHSAHLGSANHTIMFGDDYLELLGILTATDHNKTGRAFLEKREGIERTAFTTDNAAGGAEALRARGLPALGPIHFGRPVPLPGGGSTEAKFNVFRWPENETPGGIGLFACEHLTREAVWVPSLLTHANGTRAIGSVDIVANDPKAAADHLSRLIDEPVRAVDGGYAVASGGKRAQFCFFDAAGLAKRYPAAALDGATREGGAGLTLITDDLAKAKAIPGAIAANGAVYVAASAATGVALRFIPS